MKDELGKSFEALCEKNEAFRQEVEDIRQGIDAKLKPLRSRLVTCVAIGAKLKEYFDTGLLKPINVSIGKEDSRTLEIAVDMSGLLSLELQLVSLNGQWGKTTSDLKWLAEHIYDICSALENVAESWETELAKIIQKKDKELDKKRELLAPQRILQRMRGDTPDL